MNRQKTFYGMIEALGWLDSLAECFDITTVHLKKTGQKRVKLKVRFN